MDQEIVNSLRQAASDIKEGKLKAARTSLVELLRDHPEVDQAWYMLSFTVPVLERQVYALEQALKVNPQNEKALSRLRKLKGEKEPPKDAFSFKTSRKEQAERKAVEQQPYPEDTGSGGDLLSRRLLGGAEDEAEEEEGKLEPEETALSAVPESVEPAPVEPEDEEDPEETRKKTKEEKRAEKDAKYKKKVFGMRRGVFLLLLLILIFLSLGIMGYTPQIKSFVAGLTGGGAGDGDVTQTVTGDGEGAVAAGTGEPTATSGIEMPPVWTPTPTTASTPTAEPVSEPPQLSGQIIDFGALTAPDDATLSEFEQIRSQLNAMMEGVELPSVNSYLVDDSELQTALSEFARQSDYRSKAGQLGSFYVGLGFADTVISSNAVMQNMWADPNGTLYFPDSESVILIDFNDVQYQRFSYAQSLVQNFRNSENPFEELGLFPMCSPIDQQCEALYGLVKGEAAYFADLWATEYMGETAFEEFSGTEVNPYSAGADYQAPFMDGIYSLPDTYGTAFIEAIYEQGGFDALAGVYLNLPSTTEQLMHVEKYLADEVAKNVDPISVSEILGPAWQTVYEGVLGEWKTYALLTSALDEGARMPGEIGQVAAAGWGGDYAQVFFRNSTQEYVVVAEWIWDTPADRTEFADAFMQSISGKTGASRVELVTGFTCYGSNAGIDCTFTSGASVVWLHAPDESTMELLLVLYS
jgi:hypothetical protein